MNAVSSRRPPCFEKKLCARSRCEDAVMRGFTIFPSSVFSVQILHSDKTCDRKMSASICKISQKNERNAVDPFEKVEHVSDPSGNRPRKTDNLRNVQGEGNTSNRRAPLYTKKTRCLRISK